MTKEREYRAYAGACVDLANKATSDKARGAFWPWPKRGSAWLIVFEASSSTRRWFIASSASGKVGVGVLGSRPGPVSIAEAPRFPRGSPHAKVTAGNGVFAFNDGSNDRGIDLISPEASGCASH